MSAQVLSKAWPLDEDEWRMVHTHPAVGERILGPAPAMARAAQIVRSSHERFDGSGYPDGLAGEEIDIGARIVLVCDAWDVITHDQPYQQARTVEAARTEIERGAGSQFDPAVVAAFLALPEARSGLQ